MKPLYSELWPLRRASRPKPTDAERAYRKLVRDNKRKAKKSSVCHQGLATDTQHRV